MATPARAPQQSRLPDPGPEGASTGRTLILSDGGLPALLAAAVAREESLAAHAPDPTPPSIMAFGCDGPTAELRKKAVQAQAEAFGLTVVKGGLRLGSPEPGRPASEEQARDGQFESLALIAAVAQAARKGCATIVWPAQGVTPFSPSNPPEGTTDLGGLDVDRIARIIERASLVGRLVSLDHREHGQKWVEVQTPFVDLKDRQVADLVAEMESPVHCCWWWGTAKSLAPAKAERGRWYRAFEAAGWESVMPEL